MKWIFLSVLYYLLANGFCADNPKQRKEKVTKRQNGDYEYNLGSSYVSRSYSSFFPENNRNYYRKHKSQLPPYAVQMEPLVHYSQRDPLYDAALAAIPAQTHNDLAKPKDLQTDYAGIHESYYGPPKHYVERPVYIKEPEPIIEIIIKDANSSVAPSHEYAAPPPKRKKEEVQVFYVKYKKNPNGSGKNSIIYDKPIPALTPVKGEEAIDEEEEQHHQEVVPEVYPTLPPATTTIRAIIKPDSETYHADTGIHVTFGGSHHNPSHEKYSHDDDIVESAPQPAVSRPNFQDYRPEQRAPLPYTPFNYVQQQPPPQQPPQQQFKPFTNEPRFNQNVRPYQEFTFPRAQHFPTNQQLPQNSQATLFQSQNKFQFRQNTPHVAVNQQLPTHHSSVPFNRHNPYAVSHQTNFAEPVRFNQPSGQFFNKHQHQQQPQQVSFQQQSNFHNSQNQNYQQYFNHPRPAHQSPVQQHVQQLPQLQSSGQFQQNTYQTINLNDRPKFVPQINQPQQANFNVQNNHQFNFQKQQLPNPQIQQPQFHQQQQLQQHHQQHQPQHQQQQQQHQLQQPIQNTNFGYTIPPGGELVQALPKFEQHISFTTGDKLGAIEPKQPNFTSFDSPKLISQRPIGNFVTSPTPPLSKSIFQSFSPTPLSPSSTRAPTTTTTTPKPESTTINLKDLNIELPDEVPDELRNQLLSSGILKNAQISVLDYDKVGDIPLSALPPDQLANFYSAGGAQQLGSGSEHRPTVVKPDGSAVKEKSPMELKVVHYNPDTEEGKQLRDFYINENATRTEPVVLNDDTYNRYLPLKVSGAQFPVPEVPQLEGKQINSVVVLAPIDYDFYKQTRTTRDASLQSEIELVKNADLRRLVENPSTENYEKFLQSENAKSGNMQAVILLVTDNEEREIFMYDIKTKLVNKLEGQLSKAFVEAAVSNFKEDHQEDQEDSLRKNYYNVHTENV